MIFSDLAFIDFFLFGKDGLGSEESANCLPASYDVSWKKILWKWNNYSIISFLLWKQWQRKRNLLYFPLMSKMFDRWLFCHFFLFLALTCLRFKCLIFSDTIFLIVLKDRANEIYKKVEDQKSSRGRNQDALLAACLYIACRQEDKPRTVKGTA